MERLISNGSTIHHVISPLHSISGNVLFSDEYTAKQALLGLSKPLIIKQSSDANLNQTDENKEEQKEDQKEQKEEQKEQKDEVNESEEESLVYKWRKGQDCKENLILLRYATIDDVRPTEPKKSQYLWKNNNQRNEREHSGNKRKSSGGIAEMPLSADEEERRKKRRNKFAAHLPKDVQLENQLENSKDEKEEGDNGAAETKEEEVELE